ncbi:sigma-70 family RNA polymerase sigma factor [Ketobacter sp. MCCC 1A13808]|uniref:RNA polymerase sigma factor n=1 Tax=Ketobacter sp. MCCC 1A13808 TaxID=2602738 RepID=UPI000F11080D|nr:sigma-70 family RNA polymerase sigma factor [Ketobacter sp. MCCC 1A13808]MVF13369.1 sigma-70 family RNA polymerase sigma factor [Ketobacter sp. MCCC 1A13808]RLP54348.1 MAG: sigma-70 family RNA polymerase sigma factor [Ketobacter sp.]
MNDFATDFSIGQLYNDHQPALKRFLMAMLRSEQAAEDVAHEAWVRVLRYRPKQPVENPQAYLFTVGANAARDYLARESTRSKFTTTADDAPFDQAICPHPNAEQCAQDHQRLQTLARAVDDLPPRCREVFLMSRFDGLSNPDIALRLQISRNMVEKHIIKALLHCRNRLKSQGV